jgi:hypothetical protein
VKKSSRLAAFFMGGWFVMLFVLFVLLVSVVREAMRGIGVCYSLVGI